MPNFSSNIFDQKALKRISTLWIELIGSPSAFPLESRIFHSISIGLIILAAVYAPYNFYAGLYVASVSAIIFASFYAYQYYLSRFRGKAHSSTLFGAIGLVIFGANYFFTSGINGSTDLIWPAHLLLLLAISPYHQHFRWLLIYLVCFLVLHVIEYWFPSLISHPFGPGKGQFIDRITAFPIPVIVIYLVIKFIRRSYDIEKNLTEEKTKAVAQSNHQMLLQKEQLERSNAEKNKLMSIISHDLRTPLMNIQHYLELLNEDEIDAEEKPVLEKALLKSTNSAVDMLSNVLNWSKSQMEGLNVNMVEVNLFDTLLGTLEMEKLHALKKGVNLRYHISDQLIVLADVDMLQLIVRNLIGNAVKFTPSGGLIEVEAEEIREGCKITVKDNGTGIPYEKQGSIFSVESGPSYGTNNERGVGLGLALCKEFIERQGGRISLESSPGIGSSFFIFLQSKRQAAVKVS